VNQTLDSGLADVPIACLPALSHWASWPGAPGASVCEYNEIADKMTQNDDRSAEKVFISFKKAAFFAGR
jgi:hypothetical protein